MAEDTNQDHDGSHTYDFDLVRDTFDPERAKQAMGVICTAFFEKHPVMQEAGFEYCDSSWDSFLCWPATKVGEVALQSCPDLMMTDSMINASKKCMPNGTWELTNFNNCLLMDFPPHKLDVYGYDKPGVRLIYHVGYAITIIALVIALTLFMYFRALRCLRNAIHCNLIVAFLLNAISWLILHNTVSSIYESQPTICTTMVILANYIHSVPFYWMFVEGLYLFTIIVWAYSAISIRLWYYVIIGWLAPLVPTAIWAVVKLKFHNIDCLLTTDITYDFIIHVPVLLLLLGNLFFIVSIIWVLVTKLRASNTLETKQSRKAAKATAVLFPLLGVTYILFIDNPVDNEGLSLVFKHVNALLQSFQGLFVAIIYCFLNGEVQSLVRQKLSAIQDSRTLSRYTKSSFFGSPRRSSCYAMATTTINGRSTAAPTTGISDRGGAATSAPGNRCVGRGTVNVKVEDSVVDEATTTLVVCSDTAYDEMSNRKKAKICSTLHEGEAEASHSMMENML